LHRSKGNIPLKKDDLFKTWLPDIITLTDFMLLLNKAILCLTLNTNPYKFGYL